MRFHPLWVGFVTSKKLLAEYSLEVVSSVEYSKVFSVKEALARLGRIRSHFGLSFEMSTQIRPC